VLNCGWSLETRDVPTFESRAIASICGQAFYCGFMIVALKILEPGVDLLIKREDGKRLVTMLSEIKVAFLNTLTVAKVA
jgi:hypothetical protein